jgi:CubicO group peptidase (beta-lactamase class C family)
MYSTVGDLARLIALLTGAAGDTVLDANSRAQMLAFHAPFTGRRGYGLGLRLRTEAGGHVLAGHDGGAPGYAAQIAFDPQSRIGVVLLRNYNVGRTDLTSAAYALVVALASATIE